MSLNNVLLIGRLTSDCEVRKTQAGKSVGNFSLAVTRERQRDVTDFIPIVLWGQTADFIGQYARKGDMVAVHGSIQIRNYERDGHTVYVTEVHSMDASILGHAEANKQKNDLPPIPNRERSQKAQNASKSGVYFSMNGNDFYAQSPNAGNADDIQIDSDDLPF